MAMLRAARLVAVAQARSKGTSQTKKAWTRVRFTVTRQTTTSAALASQVARLMMALREGAMTLVPEATSRFRLGVSTTPTSFRSAGSRADGARAKRKTDPGVAQTLSLGACA